ncbi:MAG: hypothetical protein ABSF25_25235 [Bryobacteraceae bacterium]|jgi:hypothetical protein
MKRTLMVLLGMGCLLFADDEVKQKVQVTHTQTVALPSGGQLRFVNSIGELTVEGWDRPDVEITTIQSTTAEYASRDRDMASRELDRVKVSVAPQGTDLVITTVYPRRRALSPARLLGPATGFDLDYHVKAPRNAALTVDHANGEVHVTDMTADIRASVHTGLITLNLPQEGLYDIDAKSKIGEVISEFPGHRERIRLFGHQIFQGAPAPHKLYLRAAFGDIIIFKIEKPPSGATIQVK